MNSEEKYVNVIKVAYESITIMHCLDLGIEIEIEIRNKEYSILPRCSI